MEHSIMEKGNLILDNLITGEQAEEGKAITPGELVSGLNPGSTQTWILTRIKLKC